MEWIAFYQLEPWGCEVEYQRTGILASIVANMFAGKGKTFEPSDFIPKFGQPVKKQTFAQMTQVMNSFVETQAAYNRQQRGKG